MSKKMKLTRYADLKSDQIIAEERMAQIQTQAEELNPLTATFLDTRNTRLKARPQLMMNRKDKLAIEKFVNEQTQKMTGVINAIYENVDSYYQAKLNESFMKNKKFHTALHGYMNGQENEEITLFFAQLSQVVSKQDGERKNEMTKLQAEKSVVDKKLNNGFIRFFLKLAHYLTPYHMSPEQVVAQKQGEKSADKSKTKTNEASSVEAKKPLVSTNTNVTTKNTTFANTKSQSKFFDKPQTIRLTGGQVAHLKRQVNAMEQETKKLDQATAALNQKVKQLPNRGLRIKLSAAEATHINKALHELGQDAKSFGEELINATI